MKAKFSGILIVALMFALFLAGCGLGKELAAEISVMNKFTEEFEVSSVSVLDKYEISENEYYYYLRWKTPEGETSEILMIYNSDSDTAKSVALSDMNETVRNNWNEIKNARPDRSFSESEIEEIMSAD